jgi:hypothetical protein
MKTLKHILAISIIAIVTFSCSKDDENPASPAPAPTQIVYPEENFLNEYKNISGLQFRRNIVDVEYRLIEYIEFSASQKGKITSLKFKVPANATLNPVILRIVDLETGLAIREISTNSSSYSPDVEKTITLSPAIELDKFKRYQLGMISTYSYENRRLDGENITYPIQCGNIKIWGFSETSLITNLNAIKRNYYYGDFSFTFQRTE